MSAVIGLIVVMVVSFPIVGGILLVVLWNHLDKANERISWLEGRVIRLEQASMRAAAPQTQQRASAPHPAPAPPAPAAVKTPTPVVTPPMPWSAPIENEPRSPRLAEPVCTPPIIITTPVVKPATPPPPPIQSQPEPPLRYPAPVVISAPQPVPAFAAAAEAAAAAQAAPAPAPKRTSEDWEAMLGGNWFAKLAALVVVIGIALVLGYEFTHIGPAGIVAISLAGSSAMLVAGAVFEPRERY